MSTVSACERSQVEIIIDGSCLGNPGPGGWACILRYKDKHLEMFGSEAHTTNNRMELTAAVQGLQALKEKCEVEIITDSEYVKNGITKWIQGWKRNSWKKADKQPVTNQDLWRRLDGLVSTHQTQWKWTKGHASHEDNNRCDELASRAAEEQTASEPDPTGDPYRLHARVEA